jgi:hypothetical protein
LIFQAASDVSCVFRFVLNKQFLKHEAQFAKNVSNTVFQWKFPATHLFMCLITKLAAAAEFAFQNVRSKPFRGFHHKIIQNQNSVEKI